MKRVLNGSRFSIHWLDLGFLGWVFKLIVGLRDSILRVHIIWYQNKVSNQVWFYLLFLAYLILGLHCSRVIQKKRKKRWLLNFIVLGFVLAEPFVLEFVLAEISCSKGCRISSFSRVFELLFRFCQFLIRLIVIKSVAKKK